MPIRINLLAEQIAAAEMRRRDPVKRAMYVGGLLVALTLAWSGSIQFKIMGARSELEGHEARWKRVEQSFGLVTTNRALTAQVERKLEALHRLGTNRFLWAAPLDALQRATLPNIRLTKIAGSQAHTLTPGTRTITNGTQVIRGKPATSTERVSLFLEGRDYGVPAEQNILKFRRTIEEYPYFRGRLATNGVTLVLISEPQQDENDRTKNFVFFSLECRYPEQTRAQQ